MANNLSAFIPELWAVPALEKFRQVNLAVAVCANTTYQGTISRQGDTVHVSTVGNVTVSSYTRGTDVVYQDMNPADETLIVDQADYAAVALDDLDAAQQNQDSLSLYSTEIGVAMSEKTDTYVFSFHNSSNTLNRISNSGNAIDITGSTAGASHVYDIAVKAGQNLTERNVPMFGRWMIVTPYFFSLLQKDTVYFIKGSDLGDTLLTSAAIRGPAGLQALTARDAAMRGFVGQSGGFDVYVSNNLPGDGSGNFYCLYGQGRPISYASQLQRMEAIRLERSFKSAVRGLMLYGGKVFAEPGKALGRIYVDNS
jgi:hypothetical protein